ncbi:unnamed protein product [Cylicocyclus nassatus]|uniref:Metalloendopeptidase n=1 Tax=Cylicocyclus nassatus TaxID=53992 RepID=A0AA36DNT1_CYLNA|nr:unnamed protein product [Cylicocyclus nassatus]
MKLLFLMLVAYVDAGLPISKRKEAMRDTLKRIKTTLNKAELLSIRERFDSLKSRVADELASTPGRKAALVAAVRKLKALKKDSNLGNSIEDVNRGSRIGDFLYDSDMVLTTAQAEELLRVNSHRRRRQAFRDGDYPNTIWLRGVHYSFHDNATEKVRSVFKKAVKAWQKNTCINFYESNGTRTLVASSHITTQMITEEERIEVMVEDGCWSHVGNVHKIQELSLGEGCDSIAAASHELGHALGMFHTHSRHDRDYYIKLNEQNIRISVNSKPQQLNVKMADFLILEVARDVFVQAATVPRGCGKIWNADYSYSIFEDAVGTGPDTGESEDFRVCNHWLKAAEGKRIEVTIVSYSEGYRSPGCRYAGVEIKTQRDQRMTGYRFCSHEDAGTILVSESNIVPVITYNRADQSRTVLRYRMGETRMVFLCDITISTNLF